MRTPPPPIFDRRLVRRRLARAAAAGAEEFLLVHAGEEFCERLSSIKRKNLVGRITVIGYFT